MQHLRHVPNVITESTRTKCLQTLPVGHNALHVKFEGADSRLEPKVNTIGRILGENIQNTPENIANILLNLGSLIQE